MGDGTMIAWTSYERLVGFRFNYFQWNEEERAAYLESRRYRYHAVFTEARVLHLADAAGIVRWPHTPTPERWKTKQEVLAWLKKEFGR